MRTRHTLVAQLATLLLAACVDHAPIDNASPSVSPLIYGSDDRVEPYGEGADEWNDAAADRAVALIALARPGTSDADGGEDDSEPAAVTTAERALLCEDERFGSQLSLADCSGVLIAPDLVLTAGHCFGVDDRCDRYEYAFGYRVSHADGGVLTPLRVPCADLLIREVGMLGDGRPVDYALVRLSHPVGSPQMQASLKPTPPAVSERLSSFGFPLGLPLKVDRHAEVLSVDRTGFNLTTDSYHGSSGSGLYDADGALAGILTNGQPDFDWDAAHQCQRSRVVPEGDAGTGERAMSADVALGRACLRVPDLELCESPSAPDAGMPGPPPPAEVAAQASEPADAGAGADASVDSSAPALNTNADRRNDADGSGCSIQLRDGVGRSSRLAVCVALCALAASIARRRSRRRP